MIEVLQNLQIALAPFVSPTVLVLGGLLLLAIAVYTAGIFLNQKLRKTRYKLRKKWSRCLESRDCGLAKQNLARPRVPFFDPRDDFLEVLQETDFDSAKRKDVYKSAGFYDKDKAELYSRAWWRKVQVLHRLKRLPLECLGEELSTLVYDSSPEVRLAAVDCLGHRDEVPELDPIRLFESFPEKLDSFLVIKLLSVEPNEGFLRPLVHSEKTRLRKAGATLLGQPSRKEFLPLLEKLVGDEEYQVRERTAKSLGRVGDPKALPILGQTSDDADPGVREASAKSLGKVFHEDSIETLDDLAADENFRVRLAAFHSLARFGEEGRKTIGKHWSENRRLAREAIFESYQR